MSARSEAESRTLQLTCLLLSSSLHVRWHCSAALSTVLVEGRTAARWHCSGGGGELCHAGSCAELARPPLGRSLWNPSPMHGAGRGLVSSFAAVARRGRGWSVSSCAGGHLPCRAAGPWLARRHARHRAPAVLISAARNWQSEMEDLAAERAAAPSRPVVAKGFTAKPASRRRLAIQLYPSPCLRAANAAVTTFDASLAALARDMFDLMYRRVAPLCALRRSEAASHPPCAPPGRTASAWQPRRWG